MSSPALSTEVSAVTHDEATPAVMRRCGEYWSVAFDADAFLVRDAKGLRYLAHLLARPWVEIHALELVGLGEGLPIPGPAGHLPQAGLSPGGDGVDELLDAPARAAYRRRVADLRAELEDARACTDSERIAALRGELAFIVAELETCLGRGGRPRLNGSAGERARQSVTKAIRNAQGRVAPHSPALAEHLDRWVSTGTRCVYMPAPFAAVGWRL